MKLETPLAPQDVTQICTGLQSPTTPPLNKRQGLRRRGGGSPPWTRAHPLISSQEGKRVVSGARDIREGLEGTANQQPSGDGILPGGQTGTKTVLSSGKPAQIKIASSLHRPA